MKRTLVVLLIVAVTAGGAYYLRRTTAGAESTTPGEPGTPERRSRGGGGGGGFGGGGFGGPRLPMSVETAPVKRADMSEELTVVGNLIGAATVEAVPKVAGRLESVAVRLGDRVSRGQTLAKIEDRELLEQVRQAQASFEVSAATIRQREADLRFAQTNLDRSKNLYERQLIPKQTFDDAEARHQAGVAQLDLARAQHSQAQARLDELKINVANTTIVSPVNGFIGKRTLDPGAWVTPSSELLSVVDISVVRLVANIVEKDLRRISAGQRADVEVDAFPNEKFGGRIARVSPVLDPATRTAQIEVEIVNPQFRLKPGMYARVSFTVEHRANTLVVPSNALVDVQGQRGVFLPTGPASDVAKFQPIGVGIMSEELIEVASGLTEGDRVVTTGAAALREGDKIILPGQGGERQGGGQGRGRRGSESGRGGPAGRGPTS
jgi:membrane fusion protein, multidrug efflux system